VTTLIILRVSCHVGRTRVAVASARARQVATASSPAGTPSPAVGKGMTVGFLSGSFNRFAVPLPPELARTVTPLLTAGRQACRGFSSDWVLPKDASEAPKLWEMTVGTSSLAGAAARMTAGQPEFQLRTATGCGAPAPARPGRVTGLTSARSHVPQSR
jgi:hypothetical protein